MRRAQAAQSIALLRTAPELIPVLVYTQNFGRSELVVFFARDFNGHLDSLRHRWSGG